MSSTLALLLLAGSSQASVTLTDIGMHLFYEGTGRLSSDITQQPDFTGWNVIIGGGSAEEPANDLVVVAELQTSGEQHVETPLKIVVTNAKGRILASRKSRSTLIKDGRAYLPLWVPDAGCAGTIKVNVQFGAQRKTETVELECGE